MKKQTYQDVILDNTSVQIRVIIPKNENPAVNILFNRMYKAGANISEIVKEGLDMDDRLSLTSFHDHLLLCNAFERQIKIINSFGRKIERDLPFCVQRKAGGGNSTPEGKVLVLGETHARIHSYKYDHHEPSGVLVMKIYMFIDEGI